MNKQSLIGVGHMSPGQMLPGQMSLDGCNQLKMIPYTQVLIRDSNIRYFAYIEIMVGGGVGLKRLSHVKHNLGYVRMYKE